MTSPPFIDQESPHQHLHINLFRQKGVAGSLKTLQLFKSFALVLQQTDPLLAILPFEATKQHYSSLNSNKQIETIDESKIYQFFRPYYQKQNYSLSGYFYLRMSHTLQAFSTNPQVAEWLDINQYFIKLCPSQAEEMVQIGALCYSHILMHREELKEAILKHELWMPDPTQATPIFDLYVGDFLAGTKKTKMLFVSAEKSKQEQVTSIFKKLYDGSPKEYPNGSMMLFIPLHDNTHTSPEHQEKIIFNHNNYHGDEAFICIGGLNDLDTPISLTTGQNISLRKLLKGFPSSPGMMRPYLFQHIESNSAGMVIMATYQKQDHSLVQQ